ILAKEMAATLPLVCLLYDRFARRRARTPAAERPGLALRLASAAALLGAVIGWAVYGRFVRRVIAATPWYGGSPGTNLATVLRVWLHYLALLVWPARLSADYS